MIRKLDHYNDGTANKIYSVFQHSYQIEAQLIGTDNFPPLSRSRENIKGAKTEFYGYWINDDLAAVFEITLFDKHIDIESFTVDPQYFRRGIASKLLNYILDAFEVKKVYVETAVVNEPALKLYKKHGFCEFKQWTPSHGIKKVALSVDIDFN